MVRTGCPSPPPLINTESVILQNAPHSQSLKTMGRIAFVGLWRSLRKKFAEVGKFKGEQVSTAVFWLCSFFRILTISFHIKNFRHESAIFKHYLILLFLEVAVLVKLFIHYILFFIASGLEVAFCLIFSGCYAFIHFK